MKLLTVLDLQLLLLSGYVALPMPRVETDPELTAGYIEGDMIYGDLERNVLRRTNYRWPNRIVFYYINSDIDQDHRNQILRAMQSIEQNSCIIFKEATTDQPYYVNITSEPDGCFSTVGFHNRVQQINLQEYDVDTGCFRLGTIIHEFLHALGFYHQHSSSNRDDYVRIVEENIDKDFTINFKKYGRNKMTDFGLPYDYGSVMHYPPYAYSANDKKTIVSLHKGTEKKMGQRKKMSAIDIEKLNLMYNCPRKIMFLV